MLGPRILTRSLSVITERVDENGNRWQYHSQSDRHSKIACWGILFDLLRACPVLAQQAERGAVAYGINHEMRDFKNNRKKNLDLVLCTPTSRAPSQEVRSMKTLVDRWQIALDAGERAMLDALPDIEEAPIGAVHLALEAKAAMTAHSKARPRLYDELNSSHLTIHGATDVAIAVAFLMVNVAETFISTSRNRHDLKLAPARISRHVQPRDAEAMMSKVRELPRRTRPGEEGFDAVAIVVVDCKNDGSPVQLIERKPAPPRGDIFEYESMIRRVAQLYETRFAGQLVATPPRTEQRQNSVEKLFAAYDVLERLPTGGMSEGYKVRAHDGAGVFFLKKVPVSGVPADALRRELDVYTKLQRASAEHVLQVHAFERNEDHLALVTEFANGGSLSSHVRESGSLEPEETKGIVFEVIAGLRELHSLDIVHRDVKADNVLRAGGHWKLSDFGISKNLARAVTQGRTFQGHGTPGFAPPEQLDGAVAHPSADVYALGKLIAFLLTGQTDVDQIVLPSWAKLARRCTERAAENRPSLDDVATALEEIAT